MEARAVPGREQLQMIKPKRNAWNDPKRKLPSPQSIAKQERARMEAAYKSSLGVPLARLIRVPILANSPHVPQRGEE